MRHMHGYDNDTPRKLLLSICILFFRHTSKCDSKNDFTFLWNNPHWSFLCVGRNILQIRTILFLLEPKYPTSIVLMCMIKKNRHSVRSYLYWKKKRIGHAAFYIIQVIYYQLFFSSTTYILWFFLKTLH